MNGRVDPSQLANIVADIRDRFPVSAVAAKVGLRIMRPAPGLKDFNAELLGVQP